MIRQITAKDFKNFIYFCQTKDNFGDFFITKDNKRLYLTDATVAKKVFTECLKHGNKCFIKEEGNIILGVMLIVGYKDKYPRKYIKVLSNTKKDFEDLFSYLQWQGLMNLFIKVKNSNTNFVKFDKSINRYKPSYVLRKNGFQVIAVRDREVLLMFQGRKNIFKPAFVKSED